MGFSRIRCPECGYEVLLAFSCKRRYSRPQHINITDVLPAIL